jgi:hypothetical protein
MLKREITYEDFNGDNVTETFYFNLSKPEIVELEVEHEGGFAKMMERIVESENVKQLIEEFKKIILLSYGKKSDDGKRFIKTEQLREEFSQSAAYSELFMELATDDKAAANFIKAILPKDLATEVEAQSKTISAPKPPTE